MLSKVLQKIYFERSQFLKTNLKCSLSESECYLLLNFSFWPFLSLTQCNLSKQQQTIYFPCFPRFVFFLVNEKKEERFFFFFLARERRIRKCDFAGDVLIVKSFIEFLSQFIQPLMHLRKLSRNCLI